MELQLNPAWLALALLAFTVLLRRKAPTWHSRGSHQTSLLALAGVLLLLFPVSSASHDLHPTQAVLEGATKRVQQMVTPRQHESFSSSPSMVPALLGLYLLAALVMLATWRPVVSEGLA